MKTSKTDRDLSLGDSGISSVGAWLKAAREEKYETLEEVAKVTRIGKNYLEAIEEGAASKLPSLAYTRGFIRLYASHLGLSPEEALSLMEVSPAGPAETTPDIQLPPRITKSPLHSYRRSLIMITLLTLALASGYILLKPSQSSKTPVQSSRSDTAPSYQTDKAPVSMQQQSIPPPPTSQSPTLQKNGDNQGIVLRLKAVSDGKIHITIDGSVSQEYDLVAGDLVEWKAETAFVLDLDNAASVEGELDGVKLNPFGEQGKGAHLLLKADGIHKE